MALRMELWQAISALGNDAMASVQEQTAYQCDQCGSPEIVALPLVYQQGSHIHRGLFWLRTSQSYSAQATAPPQPRSYIRLLFLWGIPILFFFFWGLAGLSYTLEHPRTATATGGQAAGCFLFLGIICVGILFLHMRRSARYNREVYQRLHWNWSHTYKCQRCGKLTQITQRSPVQILLPQPLSPQTNPK